MGSTRQRRRSLGRDAAIAATLVVAIVLRVWLALVNTGANDAHLPVIRVIAFEHRFPAKAEEWEAFQPKLYHATVALVWRTMATRDPRALNRAAQLVSCVAGVLTLLVLLRFLREHARRERGPPLTDVGAVLAFALAALNPGLVGISGQATNDAFVILFASLTIYFGVRFFTRWRWRDFIGLVLAALLAGISKGNGLVVIIAVLVTFGVAVLLPPLGHLARRRRVVLGYAALFLLLVGPAVALIGPYAAFQREFGTPFVTNWDPSPRPHLYRETFTDRPGLTSVVHGLLTFRLVDLLRHPTSTYDRTVYPRHRTSLWTRVYAHTHSARVEPWPPAWGATGWVVRRLMRVLFVLGLLPTALLGWGAAGTAREVVRQWWARWRHPGSAAAATHGWLGTVLLVVTAGGYLAFVAVYAVRLRDYSSMKQLFLLPGLLSFTALFADGVARFRAWAGCDARPLRRVLRAVVTMGLGGLMLGYVMDAAGLIRDLRRYAKVSGPPSLAALPERSSPPGCGSRAACATASATPPKRRCSAACASRQRLTSSRCIATETVS
jgi:hypothetical protein